MIGGNFEGGTRLDSTATPSATTPGFFTPGIFSLAGATYTPLSHLNPNHPQYQSSHYTPTSETTGSQSSKRPNASEQNGTTKSKRRRGKSPDQSADSSEEMTSAISSGSPASARFLQTVDGHPDDETGLETKTASPSQQVPSDD